MRLGRALPADFVSFLRSFDGVDLFHEAIVIAGVGDEAPQQLTELNSDREEGELVFAEASGGDRFAFDQTGRVMRLRSESDERWLAGSGFAPWLDAVIAHDRLLYDADGEFSPDAFEPDGAEVVPVVALRQAERALKADPGAAEAEHERGVALRRLERLPEAADAFQRAAELDVSNPWPWFDLGRVSLALGIAGARRALSAFEAAGTLDNGATGARLWTWAARAALVCALPERVERSRREALRREPALPEALRRARDAAQADGDQDELDEAEILLEAIEGPIPRGRLRLATVSEDELVDEPSPVSATASSSKPGPQKPRPSPPRPRPAGRPKRGGSPKARSR